MRVKPWRARSASSARRLAVDGSPAGRSLLVVAIAARASATALLAGARRAPPRLADPADSPAVAAAHDAGRRVCRSFSDPSPGALRSTRARPRSPSTIAGVLVLPSDALVASDAFIIGRRARSRSTFRAGRSPGVASFSSDFDDGDRRIAAAMVRFVEGDPVSLGARARPRTGPSVLGPDDIFGYGVDSGTGAFTSPEAVAQLKAESRYDRVQRRVVGGDAWQGRDRSAEPPASRSIRRRARTWSAFASGFGDGTYPSYAGFGP